MRFVEIASRTSLYARAHGACGVPATAKSLSVNVTVTGPNAAGFLTLFPGDQIRPATSTINVPSSNQANAPHEKNWESVSTSLVTRATRAPLRSSP